MDKRLSAFLGIGLLLTLLVAGIASGFASSEPDGLEKVSIDKGFDDTADDHTLGEFPLADYSVEGVGNERLGTGLAGIIGVVITLVLMVAVLYGARAVTKRRQTTQ